MLRTLFLMLALLFAGWMITQAVAEDIEEDNDKDWSRYGVGNIRLTTESGEEIQITDSGRDYSPTISPSGTKVFFIRLARDPADNPAGIPPNDAAIRYQNWSPFDIWVKNLLTGEEKEFLRSKYYPDAPIDEQAKKNRGWFSNLQFSPDGERMYYMCSTGSPTTSAVHSVNIDGTDDRWLTFALTMDVIDNPGHEFHGHLKVVRRRGAKGPDDDMPKIMHATVILDPDTGKLRRMLDLNRPR